jgi:hypothetical protein
MIISHKYKFIFIAVPKTATHAIRFAVRPNMGAEDIEQVTLFIEKFAPFKEFHNIRHGHLTALQIRAVLENHVWQSYFKFAIVRNPFDRFISYCTFTHYGNEHFRKNPQPYLYNILFNKKEQKNILFLPQSHFISDGSNGILTDYLGRYEDLQYAFDYICSRTGMPSTQLKKINRSERADFNTYYNDELRQIVAEIYHKDLQLLQYNYDPV